MKILIVNTMAPYVWGGAEELAEHLVRNLRLRNHEVELLRVAFQWEPYSVIPSEIARFKSMRLPNVERVISMKFPAYLIPADQNTTWLVHQYRQAYDLWDSPYCNVPHNRSGNDVRNFIRASDNVYFREQKRLFTISREVSRRLKFYNGVDSVPLRAPINDPLLFSGGPPAQYILAPGRINAAKRQALLVEAMRFMTDTSMLVVAGPPETEQDAEILRSMVAKLGLESRVKLDFRFLPRNELAEYVNHATAVAYLPFQEDSYGYVVMEAYEAGKPVITCVDSGELLEIVVDGETGLVTDAEPEALASAMATLLYNPSLAEQMGKSGRNLWRSKDINWETHIAMLLGQHI